jgi:hypothetical protein
MKRYISSAKPTKLDKRDLVRKQAKWQSKYDARLEEYKSQEYNYAQAKSQWKNNVYTKINSIFGSYKKSLPKLEMSLQSWYGDGLSIEFEYTSSEAALKWKYTITLTEEGSLKKEANSWSGLSLSTSENFEDITASVNFLKAIFEYNGWEDLLSNAIASRPSYKEYVSIRDPKYDPEYQDPGYNKMIREAQLQSLIGKDVWIHSTQTDTWYKLVGETPKYFKVYIIEGRAIRFRPDYCLKLLDTNDFYEDRIQKIYFKADVNEVLSTEELKEMIEETIAENSKY